MSNWYVVVAIFLAVAVSMALVFIARLEDRKRERNRRELLAQHRIRNQWIQGEQAAGRLQRRYAHTPEIPYARYRRSAYRFPPKPPS